MTDDQNPLQAVTNMKNPEGQPPATSGPSAEELAAQQQREEAIAAEKIAAQARIQELDNQQKEQDQIAIDQVRKELPQVIKDDASIAGEVKSGADSTTNQQAEDTSPQVEQLRRLEE